MFQIFCIVCMAPHLRFNSILCQHCWNKIFPQDFKVKKRMENGVKHIYLLDWSKESDLASRSLLYFLKNKPSDFYKEFVDLAFGVDMSAVALVPACSEAKKLNHAKSLAEALLKQNKVSGVLEVGRRRGSDMVQQKQKTRAERLRSNRLDLSGSRHLKNWVFVDDVLVSGGTFKSISESMFTKPQAVFTLFYKPHLNNKGFYGA